MTNIPNKTDFSEKFLEATPSQKTAKFLLLALCGLAIGFVNGYLGAGGGMLLVPCLVHVAGLNERNAHATAIAAIVPMCAVSAAIYAENGALVSAPTGVVVGGVILGGALGAVLLKKASNKVLSSVFYGLMILAGIKMIF